MTSLRISAVTRPDSSATPAPIIAAIMSPTAVKLMKFGISDAYMKRMPSRVQQAADLGGRGLDLVRVRVDAFEGDGGAEQAEQGGEHDDDGDEDQENDHGMGNHVPHSFDTVEKPLHGGLGLGVQGLGAGACLPSISPRAKMIVAPGTETTHSRIDARLPSNTRVSLTAVHRECIGGESRA